MAQFWEDWSGSTLNAEPTGWTKQFVTSGTLYRVEEDTSGFAPAGRRLLIDKSALDRATITFDAVGASEADVQVRILVRSLGGSNAQYGGPCARISGAVGTETALYGSFTTTQRISNVQLNAGVASVLGYGALTGVYDTTEYYWLTITTSAGNVTTTISSVAAPETIVDTATHTPAVAGAGGVGVFVSHNATIFHVLAVGIGTDGDPAPYSAPAGDTTAPTLTSPTASATGATTASGSVSTNEGNGTLYYLASANATEAAATVKAGSSQAVTAIGAQNVTVSGLTASTSYYLHFVHTDAAANDSTVATSAQITTDAPSGDTEPPTLTGSVTFASITQTSYTAQWSAGADNVAVTGYEYQIGGTAGAWTDAGNSLSAAITGRTAGTTETVYVRAYDAAGLRSTPAISGEVTLLSAVVGITVPEPLKNNTGTVLASQSGIRAAVLQAADLVSVYETTGLTTNGAGILATISDAAITAGQQYHVAIKLADGGVGITGPITAS